MTDTDLEREYKSLSKASSAMAKRLLAMEHYVRQYFSSDEEFLQAIDEIVESRRNPKTIEKWKR